MPARPPTAFRELVSNGKLSIIKNEKLSAALYEFEAASDVFAVAFQSSKLELGHLRRHIFRAFHWEPEFIESIFKNDSDVFNREPGTVLGEFRPEAFFGNTSFQAELNAAVMYKYNSIILAEHQQELLNRITALIDEELSK